MRNLFYIAFVVFSTLTKGQDKLYFNSGETRSGIIVSIGKDLLYFKNSDTSNTLRIKKSDLLMAENYKGVRYLFRHETTEPEQPLSTGKNKHLNSISVQPLGLFFGRAIFRYEYLSDDGRIGLAIPIALSFNPYQNLTKFDTLSFKPKTSVNVIGGCDLNFYIGANDNSRFFAGPRFRYGTDVFFMNTEGYSLQTQIGWKYQNSRNRLIQHLSFGFGFLRVLSSAGIVGGKRTYGCYSINYSLGVKW